MKRFLCMFLMVTMMVSMLGTVAFAADAQPPAEPVLGGASILATDRNHRCSSP